MKNNKKSSELRSLSDLVCMAEVTSPHGIHGAVKLKAFTQNSSSLSHYKTLRDQSGTPYKVQILSTPTPFSAVVTLEGITDRNQAEELRGLKLYVQRDQLPALEEEEFYYTDLVGMKVVDLQANHLGKVKAVHNHGAGDFLDVESFGGEVYSISFRKETVPLVDVAARSLVIDAAFLLDSKA